MSNFQRVDIDEPVKPEGYSFVDADKIEFAVRQSDHCVQFLVDGSWQFDMFVVDISHMIKALQMVYDNLENV